MSIIERLDTNLTNLPIILAEYELQLSDYATNLSLRGKTLRDANVEQSAWHSFYDEKRVELKTLMDYLETHVNHLKGKKWVELTQNHNIDLSSSDKPKYIDADPQYVSYQVLMLEAREVYHKYIVVTDAFVSRGYSLKNLTDLYVNSLADAVI